jgi:hypothetical protein
LSSFKPRTVTKSPDTFAQLEAPLITGAAPVPYASTFMRAAAVPFSETFSSSPDQELPRFRNKLSPADKT